MSRSEKVEQIREAVQRKARTATYMRIFVQTNPPEQGRYYAQIPWDRDVTVNVTSETNAEALKNFLSAVPDNLGQG
jgi:hypothetical protein